MLMNGTKVLTLGAVGMSFTVSRATHLDYTCMHVHGCRIHVIYMRIHACGTYIMLAHALARARCTQMAGRSKSYRSVDAVSLQWSPFRINPSIELILVIRWVGGIICGTNEERVEAATDRRTDRQTDRQTHRQTQLAVHARRGLMKCSTHVQSISSSDKLSSWP